MTFFSELDHFYEMHFGVASHRFLNMNPQGMTHPHHHRDYEIYFLISGNRKYFVEDRIYMLQPNQVVIFKPNVSHQVTVNLEIPYERQLVYVTPQLFSDIISENNSLKPVQKLQLFNLSEEDFSKALEYVKKINGEVERNDEFTPDIIKNTLAELLAFICRHNDTSQITVNSIDSRIQSAIDFILENYKEPITLGDVAKIACMDTFYFSRTFHKITALTFKEFLNKIRIDKACELLTTTNSNISYIAQSVGFNTDSHFSYVFKEIYQMTPSQYRKQNIKN